MASGDVETYYENGQWKNKVKGSSLVSSSHENKGGAIAAGRQMAALRRVEHIIHRMDGTIEEQSNYREGPSDLRR